MSGALSLVLIAFVGTAILIAIAFLMGFSKVAVLKSPNAAMAVLSSTVAGEMPKSALLSNDRFSALVLGNANRLFLVVVSGDSHVVRVVCHTHIDARGDGFVRLDFKDVGFPPFEFAAEPIALEEIFSMGRTAGNI
jgi:hypothetical protein